VSTVTATPRTRPSPRSATEPPATAGWTFADGRAGRFGVVFAAVWLVFLADSFRDAWRIAWGDRDSAAGWVGLFATVAFAVAYIAAFSWLRGRRHRLVVAVEPVHGAAVISGLCALGLLMCVTIGESGSAAAVYVAVVAVLCLRARFAVAFTALLAGIVELSGRLVPGWSDQSGLTFAVCTAAFAMWGIQQMMLRNLDLVAAREENARLAVAEERNRFGRDLHDILGHSLTVITVKAELANRLLDADPPRARQELADLERLSRDALADVRRAVEGYREITLPGELARARQALAAAGIEASLPNSTDDVASELRELFAWTVREGITNVVRHSGASRCTVTLRADAVLVSDDGKGAPEEPGWEAGADGHGLAGLRERAAAAGAVLETGAVEPHGFTLEVRRR
jgi:two-component system, NarL family, sensor histidine kinase DesK